MPQKRTDAFRQFDSHQRELNHFLWTTELTYCIVKHRRILKKYPDEMPAHQALADLASEAWFPSSKGDIKYRQSIGHMQQQLDKNFVFVLSSVAVLFVTYFEVFVQERFPRLKNDDKRRTIPAPCNLLRDLQRWHPDIHIAPDLTLKADLIKAIRNIYVHEGMGAVPRTIESPHIRNWIKRVKGISPPYSPDLIERVVLDVVGNALTKSRTATRGKTLPVEFFYALFTFTDIRNFAEALETSFPVGS